MMLATGISSLWITGSLFLVFLAMTAWVARPAIYTIARKTLKIDDAGVRWLISGKVRWDVAWDEIKSAHSIDQYVPDDLPIRGFGIKTNNGKEHNIGDLPDLGPTSQLEEAFNIIGEELVRRGIPVEDEAGWAGAAVLADKVGRGEISPDPKFEGRWFKSGVDVKPLVGILVLGVVLAMVFPILGTIWSKERAILLFEAAYVIISLALMGIIWYLLVRKNISGLMFDEKKVVLRAGHVIRRELSFDWSEIGHISSGPTGEPAVIRLKSGTVFKAVFPKHVKSALLARFGAYSYESQRGRIAPRSRARWNPAEEKTRHNI
jgi:hypothetical protein